MPENKTARVWLRENGYDDIADMIDEILEEWASKENRTRRNWWDILAGDKFGNPRIVAGRTFPVLKAAQLRQGKKTTTTSIQRNQKEEKQKVWKNARWQIPERKDTTDGQK